MLLQVLSVLLVTAVPTQAKIECLSKATCPATAPNIARLQRTGELTDIEMARLSEFFKRRRLERWEAGGDPTRPDGEPATLNADALEIHAIGAATARIREAMIAQPDCAGISTCWATHANVIRLSKAGAMSDAHADLAIAYLVGRVIASVGDYTAPVGDTTLTLGEAMAIQAVKQAQEPVARAQKSKVPCTTKRTCVATTNNIQRLLDAGIVSAADVAHLADYFSDQVIAIAFVGGSAHLDPFSDPKRTIAQVLARQRTRDSLRVVTARVAGGRACMTPETCPATFENLNRLAGPGVVSDDEVASVLGSFRESLQSRAIKGEDLNVPLGGGATIRDVLTNAARSDSLRQAHSPVAAVALCSSASTCRATMKNAKRRRGNKVIWGVEFDRVMRYFTQLLVERASAGQDLSGPVGDESLTISEVLAKMP